MFQQLRTPPAHQGGEPAGGGSDGAGGGGAAVKGGCSVHSPRTRDTAVAAAAERNLRAGLVATQIVGMVMSRYIWQVGNIATLLADPLPTGLGDGG
ncbi:hypothetical protein [Kitasatospora sp. NPDC088346]|uniref:TetR/AcrR family transcriptional regulator n=1 Tax=Kitasatospora sp. NPDC088346 TaxID=3364073 RepID=UPI00381C1546